jgi:DNA-3-methyladenine glycosylase II
LDAGPPMRSFTFKPVGPFSLSAAAAHVARLPAATAERTGPADLALAFVADQDWVPVGVELSQRGSAVNGRFWGEASAEDVRRQVKRILSLDVDGRRFAELADRDAVVARLTSEYPGLRPICCWSPYEAAVVAVLEEHVGHEGASIRRQLTEQLGHDVVVNGKAMRAFPAPQRLAALDQCRDLDERTLAYLRAVAAAALARDLDGDVLRDMPKEQALANLRRIPGVGSLASEHILSSGVGGPDLSPACQDVTLTKAIADAYGLDPEPTAHDLDAVTDSWRPFRSWVSFLLRARAQGWDLAARVPTTRDPSGS